MRTGVLTIKETIKKQYNNNQFVMSNNLTIKDSFGLLPDIGKHIE